ncbi:MAG: hypothetical protein JNM93_06925 [Bacteriovoracaceae bacterium]|nr:hypothetical protein [Bacteriovoracaceae bacterium]
MRNLVLTFLIVSLPAIALAKPQEETLLDPSKNPQVIDQSENEFPVNNRGGISKFQRITEVEKAMNDLMGRVRTLENQMAEMKTQMEAMKSKSTP